MSFTEMLVRAKQGEEVYMEKVWTMYRPLIIKKSLVNGIFDEDLYQELSVELVKSIRNFRVAA